MKSLHGAIPLAVLAATARAHVPVIGGSGGTDIGNHASIPTENTFSSSVDEDYQDDHSVDIDETTIIKPGRPKRDNRGDAFPQVPVKPTTLIGGPSGIDVGNTVDIPTLNEFSSSITESYTDDHSVDIDVTTIIKPYHRQKHPAVGFHHPMHQARNEGPSNVIGPNSFDSGNSFDATSYNSFDTDTNVSVDDDHSVKINSYEVIAPGGHDHDHHDHHEQPHYEGQEEEQPSKPAFYPQPEAPAP
ncbi:hypothetical protein BDW59DRAFT_165466, partial [Aspergillus cavernicola]